MRRPAMVGLMLGVIGLSSVIAVITFRAPSDGDDAPSTSRPASRELPGPSEPSPPPRGALSLRGRVLTDEGVPVRGVEVSASRALPGESLSALPCGQDAETPLSSSACMDSPALLALRGLIDEGRGAAPLLTRATTAEDGTFVLEGLPEGSVALWAMGPQGSALELDVATSSQAVELILQPSDVFTSRVVDEAVRPVADASVTLFHAEHSRYFETRTDSEGRFRVGPLPPGDYALVVSSPGFLTAHLTDLIAEDLSAEDLVLHRPRRIVGQVLLDERPVAGVRVWAHDTEYEPATDAEAPFTDITDAQGRFVLEDVSPGDYVLRAEEGDHRGRTETTLAEEQAEAEVTLNLGTVVTVEGVVRDEAGQPVPDAKVTLDTHGDVSMTTIVDTGADGRFVFHSATLGHNDFSVFATGYQQLSVSDVVVTRKPAPLDFTLKRAFVLEGLVTDTEGNPLTEADVTAMKWRGEPGPRGDGTPGSAEDLDDFAHNAETAYASTEEEGRFVLNLSEPGLHRLKAQAPGFLETEWKEAQAPSRDVRLVLRRGASVEGTVVNTSGAPLSAIQVSLWEDGQDSASSAEVTSDELGHFSLRGLAPGRYSLRAFRTRGGPPRARLPVVLQGAETKTVTLSLEPGLSLSGLVVDEAGKPMSGADVHAYVLSEQTSQPRFLHHGRYALHDGSSVTTDAQGRFTFDHLSPGACKLSVRKEGFELMAEPLQDEDGARSRTPQVLVAAGTTNVRLVLRYQGGIRGRLVREDGTPITRFDVNEESFREPNGTFQIAVEEPGRSWVTLEAPGLTRVLREVQVEAGRDTDLGDVVLKAGRRLRGRVLDAATSTPVVGVEVQVNVVVPASSGEEDASEETQSLAHARTGADGAFVLPPLEAGTAFRVELSHPDYLPLSQQVGPGETTLELRLLTGARLDGTVKDREGRLISTFLHLHPLSPLGSDSILMEEDGGTFHATGLAPGEYSLVARAATSSRGDTLRFMPQRVKLGPGERKELHLQALTGGASLKLRPPPYAVMNQTAAVMAVRYYLFSGTVPVPKDMGELEHLSDALGIASASDFDSTFDRLPAGHYTYVLMGRNHMSPNWVIHRGEVDLPAQGAVTLDIPPVWLPLPEAP